MGELPQIIPYTLGYSIKFGKRRLFPPSIFFLPFLVLAFLASLVAGAHYDNNAGRENLAIKIYRK